MRLSREDHLPRPACPQPIRTPVVAEGPAGVQPIHPPLRPGLRLPVPAGTCPSLVLAPSRAGHRGHRQVSVYMQPAPQLLPACPRGPSSPALVRTARGGQRGLPSPRHLPVAFAMSTALSLPAHPPHVLSVNPLCCCSAVTRRASPRPHRVPSSHGTGSQRLRLWPSQEAREAVRTRA